VIEQPGLDVVRDLKDSQYKERDENDVTTNEVVDEVKVLDNFCKDEMYSVRQRN
jgi:hypothetical protein